MVVAAVGADHAQIASRQAFEARVTISLAVASVRARSAVLARDAIQEVEFDSAAEYIVEVYDLLRVLADRQCVAHWIRWRGCELGEWTFNHGEPTYLSLRGSHGL